MTTTELESEILRLGNLRSSRKSAEDLASLIAKDESSFAMAIRLFRAQPQPVPQRIAWAIQIATGQRPELAQPYLSDLILWMPHFEHPGQGRNILKMFMNYPEWPEEILGDLFETCFNLLTNPNLQKAIRIYSMEILFRITQLEPELKRELKLAIQEIMQEEGGFWIAFRAEKMLRKL